MNTTLNTAANLATLRGDLWLIDPIRLRAACQIAGGHMPRERSDTGGGVVWSARPQYRSAGGAVAVLPLYGIIEQRQSMFGWWFGGTSTEAFKDLFNAALADEMVQAIVLDIDSPGGTSAGVDELAAHIFKSRGAKKILGVSNSDCCSAAYWIGSASDQLYSTTGGRTGSIGVYIEHWNEAKMLEGLGLEHTFIQRGDRKTDGNPYEPLSETAREELQGAVDDTYKRFVGSVARHRGVNAKKVESSYGQGRTFAAGEALDAGVIDGILTLEQVVAKAIGKGGKNGTRADATESGTMTINDVRDANGDGNATGDDSGSPVSPAPSPEVLRLRHAQRKRSEEVA